MRHRGVGGFLGVGQKDVAMPFKELKVSTRDGKDWLVLNRTKDELKMARAFNNTAPSAYARRVTCVRVMLGLKIG